MKKLAIMLLAVAIFFTASTALADDDDKGSKSSSAAGNFTIGLGPVGNVFIVDTLPELDPGVGGYLYFDYRWSPQFSTQFGVLVTTEDGTGRSNGDNGIEFLGIPTFDLKFYILSNPSRWDPYGLIGIGVYAITEGSADNGTKAVGVGANVGLGFDYYVSERFSIGLAAVFRSIGLIDSTGPGNNGTASFPFSMMGNMAYHF